MFEKKQRNKNKTNNKTLNSHSNFLPSSAPVQICWLAPAFNVMSVNAISVSGRANASRVLGGRVSCVETVHALVVMKGVRMTSAVIQQSL